MGARVSAAITTFIHILIDFWLEKMSLVGLVSLKTVLLG